MRNFLTDWVTLGVAIVQIVIAVALFVAAGWFVAFIPYFDERESLVQAVSLVVMMWAIRIQPPIGQRGWVKDYAAIRASLPWLVLALLVTLLAAWFFERFELLADRQLVRQVLLGLIGAFFVFDWNIQTKDAVLARSA